MNRSARLTILCVVTAVLAWLGVSRISFEVDLLSMLPSDLPNVKAVKIYREHFDQRKELFVAVEHPDAMWLEESMPVLAADLEAAGLAARTDWRTNPLEEAEGIAGLIAYLWMNADPAEVAALAERLATPEAREAELADAIDSLSGGDLFGTDAMMRQYDPFGFTRLAVLERLLAGAPGGDAYASPDGTTRLIFFPPPREMKSYRKVQGWMREIEDFLEDWKAADPARAETRFGISGEGAFKASAAGLIEREVGLGSLITALVVALLFLWLHRRFAALAWLIVSLVLIFAITLNLGALIFGTLSVMSIGFASILVGLAADYGVLASQYRGAFGGSVDSIRRRLGGSIGWAALTTASVFLVLNLSSFPGVAELGTIVAIGIAAAALVTLYIYLPVLGPGEAHPTPVPVTAPRLVAGFLPGKGMLMGAAVTLLLVMGPPGLDYRIQMLPEDRVPPFMVFREIQKKIPAWSEEILPVLVKAGGDGEMVAALADAREVLERLENEGVLDGFFLPDVIWPDAARQKVNAPVLRALVEGSATWVAEAEKAGFSDEGTALTAMVTEAWRRDAAAVERGETAWPTDDDGLTERFAVRKPGVSVLCGIVRPAEYAAQAAEDFERLADLNSGGMLLAAWQTLQSSVKPLMLRDLRVVVVPTALVLLVLLGLVFRDKRDFLLAVGYLLATGVLLAAWMRLADVTWTFQNLSAMPVLLGTAIDYCIHILLAMRRYQGDLSKVWVGTGKALLFCAATTATGFGTLMWVSDPGLAGFGKIACAGILIAILIAVGLLPLCWRRLQKHHLESNRTIV